VLGIIAGYIGGWADQIIMRITDAWLALPALTFAIFLAAIVGPSMWNIVIILGAVYWTRYARVVRGEVLSLKERDFVRLAVVAGCSKWTIMRRHILPNVANSAIVLATLMLGVVIVTEASLSFLGVGVPPPQPAWGLMLSDGKQGLMVGYWWLTVFPGVCIMLMVLSANLLGDWLRVKLAATWWPPSAARCWSSTIFRRITCRRREPVSSVQSMTCRCASTPARRSASLASPAPARALSR
jgi:peptide/nickel transport system permease protein